MTARRTGCSPSGTTLAFASSSSAVQLWDLHAQRITATLPHPGPVPRARHRRDIPRRHTLATGAADGIARIWHLPGPVLTGHEVVNGVAFSPDGQTLSIASGGAQLWNVAERRQIGATLPNAARFSGAIAFTGRPGPPSPSRFEVGDYRPTSGLSTAASPRPAPSANAPRPPGRPGVLDQAARPHARTDGRGDHEPRLADHA